MQVIYQNQLVKTNIPSQTGGKDANTFMFKTTVEDEDSVFVSLSTKGDTAEEADREVLPSIAS